MSRSTKKTKFPWILEYAVYDKEGNCLKIQKYPYRLLSYITEDLERGEFLIDESHRVLIYRLEDDSDLTS